MRVINVSELRGNLLKYLQLANSGEPISISSRGRVLATLCGPVNQKQLAQAQLRVLARGAKLHDVIAPTGSKWEVG